MMDLVECWPTYLSICAEQEEFSKSPIPAFYAYRTSSYDKFNTTIPYSGTSLNTNNVLNTATGVFTAPAKGLYYFYFSATKQVGKSSLTIELRKNNEVISIKHIHSQTNGTEGSANHVLPIDVQATLSLNVNDTVYAVLGGDVPTNAIVDSMDPCFTKLTSFTGFLIQPM